MDYYKYLDEVFRICIVDDDDAWTCYLRPNWRYVLDITERLPDIVLNYKLTLDELYEILQLEVERRRVLTNRSSKIMQVIWDYGQQLNPEKKDSVMQDVIKELVSNVALGGQNKEQNKSIIPGNISYKKPKKN